MTVTFYSLFSKRFNSTKRPSGGTEVTCYMKENTSALRPTIILDYYNGNYNYASINFGGVYTRFYYVEEPVFSEGLWEYKLREDVLATFRSDIGNAEVFALRSSSEYSDYIADSLTISENKTETVSHIISPFTNFGVDGYYIISICGKNGMKYFALDYNNTMSFFSNIFNKSWWEAEGVSVDESTFNPLQFISSLTYIPLTLTNKVSVTIPIAWNEMTLTGREVLPGATEVYVGTYTVNHHPLANTVGKYLNMSPYMTYILRFGPFGEVELPGDIMYAVDTMNIKIVMDNLTGEAVLYCTSYDDQYNLAYLKANLGVALKVGTYTSPKLDKAFSLLKIGGGIGTTAIGITALAAAVASPVGAEAAAVATATTRIGTALATTVYGVGSAASGIQEYLANSAPKTGVTGGLGSFADISDVTGDAYSLTTQTVQIGERDNSRSGKPLCKEKTVSDIPGFIICRNGEIETDANFQEKAEIKAFLEGGFFYE